MQVMVVPCTGTFPRHFYEPTKHTEPSFYYPICLGDYPGISAAIFCDITAKDPDPFNAEPDPTKLRQCGLVFYSLMKPGICVTRIKYFASTQTLRQFSWGNSITKPLSFLGNPPLLG